MSKPEVVGLPVLGADAVVPCCPPITAGELLAEDAEKTAAMSKALGDPVRLRLFLKVASHADGEACVCGITGAGVAQPTVSRRLKKLHEAGLLTSGRHGTWVCRKAAPPVVAAVPVLLDLR